MKLFLIVAFPLALVMSFNIPITPLENSLVDVQENGKVNKENNFDKELQKYNLTSFKDLLVSAKLFDTLNDPTTSYTVFALTNKAIENAPSGLLSNATRLPEVLKYHVHLGSFRTNMITRDMRLKTLVGGQCKIRFGMYAGAIYGSCQQMDQSIKDETYDNGILDVMNGVMEPPESNLFDVISKTATFETLLKYVSKAGLERFLQVQDAMTVLAPNDAAFKKLSQDVIDKLNGDDNFLHSVMEYHILTDIYCSAGFENGEEVETYQGANVKVQVSGPKVTINNSTIIQADIIAYNGVVQVIDTVLLPPQLF